MKSPKFYKTIIAVLVTLNIAILAFFWLVKPPHPPKPGEHKLAIELGLESNKLKKVNKLEVEHHKAKRNLIKKDRDLHELLFDKIGTGDSSGTQLILEKIDVNREEIDNMTISFFNEVAEYCNEQQKKDLREFVKKTLRGLRPMHPKK
jgi:hypothetical protein